MVNNIIPNGHFHKKWHQTMIKTWFNQPARKVRRRNARAAKAARVFPRPVAGALRPVVVGQTVKYNMKKRLGRGFSLEELKAAGVPRQLAPTIGVSVDHRRKNRSAEGFERNVQRLKEYLSNLIVFPKNAKKPKAKDASAAECKTATQLTGTVLPITKQAAAPEFVAVSAEMKSFRAHAKISVERANQRWQGRRLKRAAEEKAKAEEAARGK